MTAIFGIEEGKAQGPADQCLVCYPRSPAGRLDLHAIVSTIRNQDIVFLKRCTQQSRLCIKAVGIVQSGYSTESDLGICLPVEWVWRGEKVLENLGETLPLCGDALYEEHNIVVQREIINLLPEKYQLPLDSAGHSRKPSQ